MMHQVWVGGANINIVTYAGTSGVHLPSTSASKKMKIISAIESLKASGNCDSFCTAVTLLTHVKEALMEVKA